MFFKYQYEMDESQAKTAARIARRALIQTIVPQYHALERINQANPNNDMSDLLAVLCEQLHHINTCENSTDALEAALKNISIKLICHTQYTSIEKTVNTCLRAIQVERYNAKDRNRYIAQNQLTKIENRAIYTASIPSIAVIVGGILAIANPPVGLIISVLALCAGILSQMAYWAYNYGTYTQIGTLLKSDMFEGDIASGPAVDVSELPVLPQKKLDIYQDDYPKIRSEKPPVLITETVDQLMDELSEAVPELVTDAAAAVSHYAFHLWASARDSLSGPPISLDEQRITRGHLHIL